MKAEAALQNYLHLSCSVAGVIERKMRAIRIPSLTSWAADPLAGHKVDGEEEPGCLCERPLGQE